MFVAVVVLWCAFITILGHTHLLFHRNTVLLPL